MLKNVSLTRSASPALSFLPAGIRSRLSSVLALLIWTVGLGAGWGIVAPSQGWAQTDNDYKLPQTSEQEKQVLKIASPTPAAAKAVAASNQVLPPIPTGLSSLMLKEGVYISWAPAAAGSPVVGYEVYRSDMPGAGYRLLNPKPVTSPYFLDGAGTNLPAPENGNDYFYVVAAIDAQGNVSAYSDEMDVTPEGLKIPAAPGALATATPTPRVIQDTELKIPDSNLLKFKLPADSQLSIQGYKQIEADFSFQTFDRKTENGIPPTSNTTNVNQQLVVNLDGKVGKNVDVHVDYSDVNRTGGLDQTQQEISIVYHGDQDSPVQEVSFGDLNLVLPNTEFAGFNKQLFGIQAKLKFDDFRLTSFFAQTKGISETKIFKGDQVQVNQTINDIQFIPYKYFLMTKSVIPGNQAGQTINMALPANGTEQIWVDPGNGQVPPQGPNYIGPFQRFLPGRDYTIDYSTGIVTFITYVNVSSRIAVAYQQRDGQYVGENANGQILDLNNPTNNPNLTVPPGGIMQPGPNHPHLIKNNTNPADVSPLYLVNYYSLGTVPIVPPNQDPNFQFQIINQGTNNVVQTGDPAGSRWNINVDTDLNVLVVNDTTNPNYPERPFANPAPDNTNGTGPNDVYSQTTTPTSLYRMQLIYDTKQNYYNMGRLNILRGSETVYLDGRLLHRDTDYYFDYDSGTLDFQDKSILRPDSQVVVTYEYSPFGAFAQENILGTRAEYDVTDHFFLGSTFLYSSTQQPTDVPDMGSEPNDLAIVDADARLDLDRKSVKSLTSLIPGLENWTPPLSVNLSGEIAKSFYDPNTFNMEGETGVAMIDNMDGIDSATNLSVNATSWVVSPPPESVPQFLGSATYDGSSDASTNNRARFFNYDNGYQFQTISSQEVSNPDSVNGGSLPPGAKAAGVGGHIYATTQNPNDLVSVLEFPYSKLTNQRWAGVRQSLSTLGTDLSNSVFFESWIYNDGNDKWIMADFGSFAEDTNGNNVLDQDTTVDASGNTIPAQAHPDSAYGIPSYYLTNSLSAPGLLGAIIGLPSETGSTQEGVNDGGAFITEDQNGDGVLDGSDGYYEYGIRANWKGWKLVKIPVNLPANTAPPPDSSDTTDGGVDYFFHTVGTPNSQVVRAVRLWTTGTSSTPQDGYFMMESMGFTHNLWQLQVDPTANVDQGVTVNTSKFDVATVNQPINSSYNPTLRFVTLTQGVDQSSLLAKESALQITYNLSSADLDPSGDLQGRPVYYATRTFSQILDFTNYKDLRFDLEAVAFNPGDILFLRLGNDQQDYYQYNIPLTTAYQNNLWKSVVIDLDGSDGNRSSFGTPFLNRVSQISFGVLSPNPPTYTTNELWINNLRSTDPQSRSGLARRANATVLLGDNFATINARYREVDSGFTELDQQATRFQHSTQLGADYSSSAVKLFSQPLVTQFSYTHQDTYTEDADKDNPNFELLPNSYIDSTTGSISYAKDLGPNWGRITSLRVSESTNDEKDVFEPVYLAQAGVQGNTNKAEQVVAVASTYDAPSHIFSIPIGTNQLTQTYTLTHDSQDFDFASLTPYDRTTRNQVYGWSNTTQLLKDLVFTPGYTLTMVDGIGNTNTPGVPGGVPEYTAFQRRYQPKAGLVYRGIPGLTPSVNYTGSVQYDYISFAQPQFTNANSLDYLFNLTPASWFPFLRQTDLTVDAGRTESSNTIIYSTNPNQFTSAEPLSSDQIWLISKPTTIDYSGTESITDRLNASFKILNWWDVRPTGSWGQTYSVTSLGTFPTEQDTQTWGFNTVWNRKILSVPFINFHLNSVQVQYTRNENLQYDSSEQHALFSQTSSDVYSVVVPYDIDKGVQGNFRVQVTDGTLYSQGVFTSQSDEQFSVEYNQNFLGNQTIHIPFTHWKLKLTDPLEARLVLTTEFVNNQSDYSYDQLVTKRYNGTLSVNYNALKNLRIGLGFSYEHLDNFSDKELGYDLIQATISGEARF